MFYNAFPYTKQCFTMHFYIQNNAFLFVFPYTKQCFTMHFYTVKQCFTMHFSYTKQCFTMHALKYFTMHATYYFYIKECFTMHFYIQNNVLQCISIYKTMFYNAFLYRNNILLWIMPIY